jgi:hypothetical protein
MEALMGGFTFYWNTKHRKVSNNQNPGLENEPLISIMPLLSVNIAMQEAESVNVTDQHLNRSLISTFMET